MGNPIPESTLTLCQSRLYPPIRDFGFGLCSHNKRDCSVLINKLLFQGKTSTFVLKGLFLGKRLFLTALQRYFFRLHLRGSFGKKTTASVFNGTLSERDPLLVFQKRLPYSSQIEGHLLSK
jgi:hypothetical protein